MAIAEEQNFVYDDHGNRDPFWPLVTSNGLIASYETNLLVSELILEGIIVGKDGQNFAVINGAIVKSKDRLGEYIIQEISSTKVVLIKGEERFELKLKKEE